MGSTPVIEYVRFVCFSGYDYGFYAEMLKK
jgi:hypothetical protein